ncbi:MAG: FAD:protein FMN transferase [Lachnospiraceae bacterium]|nr:FAD:protein FMN transferase [Lachnospiraceae bacterium]
MICRERRGILLLLMMIFLCFGCAQADSPAYGQGKVKKGESQKETATFFAMDTVMEITVYGDPSLLEAAEEKILSLEKKMSVTNEESEISLLNQNGEQFLSSDTKELLSRALELCGQTDGRLDISIYPIVRTWGFTTGEYRVPSGEELQAFLPYVDYTKILVEDDRAVLKEGMQIDLGSVAKGYAGDQVIELFCENGVTSALLNLGGNVQALGTKPDGSLWKIAIRNPMGEGYAGALEIADKAVVTSGGYERYFVQDGKTYRHIMDPETGYPVENGLVSVTVVGDEGVSCDACSTALFVMGLEDAINFWRKTKDLDFEAVFITEEGKVFITEGLEGCFTLTGAYANAEMAVIQRE